MYHKPACQGQEWWIPTKCTQKLVDNARYGPSVSLLVYGWRATSKDHIYIYIRHSLNCIFVQKLCHCYHVFSLFGLSGYILSVNQFIWMTSGLFEHSSVVDWFLYLQHWLSEYVNWKEAREGVLVWSLQLIIDSNTNSFMHCISELISVCRNKTWTVLLRQSCWWL